MNAQTTTGSRTVQSVDRSVNLMFALADADAPLSLAHLATRCGLERPTAWRLLMTLQRHNVVERIAPSNGYRLAFGALRLSNAHAIDSLARVARPLLTAAAEEMGVTASLAFAERFGVVYIDQVDSAHFTSPNWDGRALSLHGSSPGKAILAALPAAEIVGMVGPTLERLTDTTITDLNDLMTELETVRAQGYAVSRGEDVTYSNGASAVVLTSGRPSAAIDLWGPERLVPPSRLPDLGTAAAAVARQLEELLDRDTRLPDS